MREEVQYKVATWRRKFRIIDETHLKLPEFKLFSGSERSTWLKTEFPKSSPQTLLQKHNLTLEHTAFNNWQQINPFTVDLPKAQGIFLSAQLEINLQDYRSLFWFFPFTTVSITSNLPPSSPSMNKPNCSDNQCTLLLW